MAIVLTKDETHPLWSVRRLAEETLTVRDAATFSLETVSPDENPKTAATRLEAMDIDFAPVADSPIYRYVAQEHLKSGAPIAEVSKLIDARNVLAADLSLFDGLRSLKHAEFFFVLERQGVTGIITRADLQRPAVTMLVFSLILAAETGMNRLIEAEPDPVPWTTS